MPKRSCSIKRFLFKDTLLLVETAVSRDKISVHSLPIEPHPTHQTIIKIHEKMQNVIGKVKGESPFMCNYKTELSKCELGSVCPRELKLCSRKTKEKIKLKEEMCSLSSCKAKKNELQLFMNKIP